MNTRENFGSKLGAILAAAGSAVGLGNVWRFPIETGQHGGAAFIIIYIVCIMVLGIPIMMSEFLIGRRTHSNTARAYATLAPGTGWKWVGRLGVFTGTFILCYYCVIGGWTLHYTTLAATNAFDGVPATEFGDIFTAFVSNKWMPTVWLILFMLMTHVVVSRGIQHGIERFSKVIMPTLFILVVVLVVCSVCLPGASKGIEFLLKPDFSKVTGKVVLGAMGQAFFSLSLGMGCLCTYASYFNSHTNLGRTALNVCVIDTIVAIMAGFIIFPSVFNIGMDADHLQAGANLLFISLPNVFQKAFGAAPILALLFSTAFYFLIFIAALTSAISLHEVTTAFLCEELKLKRRWSALIVTAVCSIVGVFCSLSFGPLSGVKLFGMTIFDFFDYISGNIFLPVAGLLISVFAGWYLDRKVLHEEFTNHDTLHAPYIPVIIFILRYIAPIGIGLVLLNQLGAFSWL